MGFRAGLASSYLRSLAPGKEVKMHLRRGARLDLQGVECLFLIGAGSGVAPLRSFWQEFSASQRGSSGGRVVLYQGCRTKTDEAYTQEIKEEVAKGYMEYHLVCSRENSCCYVQDELARHPELWSATQHPGTRIFVSGATRVAQAVRQTLMSAGCASGLSEAEALAAVQALKDRCVYAEDVFGGPEHEPSRQEHISLVVRDTNQADSAWNVCGIRAQTKQVRAQTFGHPEHKPLDLGESDPLAWSPSELELDEVQLNLSSTQYSSF